MSKVSWKDKFKSKSNIQVKKLNKSYWGNPIGSKMLIPSPKVIQEYINNSEFGARFQKAIDKLNNEFEEDIDINHKKSQYNFVSYVSKVDTIILKLESLEIEKNKLKDELRSYEHEFLKKKKIAEDKISKISQEKEIIDKTLNVIKNLKNF